MMCVLGTTGAAAISVMGFEVAAIGALQQQGRLRWSWLLLVGAASASVIGGFVYGGLRKPPSVFTVTAGLGLLCMPIGLAATWYWLCLFALPANFLVAPALSASADAISRLAPENSKGVAMGSYASAVLAGSVIGSPVAGALLDHGGPAVSFAVFGAITLVLGGLFRLGGLWSVT